MVFNIELYKDSIAPGNLATSATFLSNINDGQNGDPLASAAFAVSYAANGNGRLIDTLLNGGPRLEPIFTYPTAQPGKLIGQGAGYKEWNRTGNTSVFTLAGVGMVQIPNGAGGHVDGLGEVPIAEGQIDMSNLTDGTYILQVVAGNGNNVLRGDLNMLQATNRPAFAVAVNETAGDTITFTVGTIPVCNGVVGRYVYYNNSYFDGNTPAITANDANAIACAKVPLVPGGGTASFANVISYDKGINGIIIDACKFNRLPVLDQDIFFLYGNDTGDPYSWNNLPLAANEVQMQLIPGATGNDPDRLVIALPDNRLPNSNWLLVAISAADPGLGLPADDSFMFGVAKGESDGSGIVNATDELLARNNPRGSFNRADVCNLQDYNRDSIVNATDQLISRNNFTTSFNRLKYRSW